MNRTNTYQGERMRKNNKSSMEKSTIVLYFTGRKMCNPEALTCCANGMAINSIKER